MNMIELANDLEQLSMVIKKHQGSVSEEEIMAAVADRLAILEITIAEKYNLR